MMKTILFTSLLTIIALQACIKDAPLNPEADIEEVILPTDQITSKAVVDQANKTVLVFLKPDAEKRGIAPSLKLSSGATSVPASGDTIKFATTPKYIVTSASGQSKEYIVKVVNVTSWIFNFEKWSQNSQNGYEFPLQDNDVEIWSSGNPGVALSGVEHTTSAYPTRSTTDGLAGTKAAELVTLKGNFLSELVGIKLFAGSLYLGQFNSSLAFTNPLAATEFGQPYVGSPDRFTGYYKYTPGAQFQDKAGNILTGETDKCAIYAVLYQGPERLNATNINSTPKVIARADLTDGLAKANFTKFDIPFKYVDNAKTSDNMMLAIIASSSYQGDQYRGAIGSKLVVDSLNIITKK